MFEMLVFMRAQPMGSRGSLPIFILGDFGCATANDEVAEHGDPLYFSPVRISHRSSFSVEND